MSLLTSPLRQLERGADGHLDFAINNKGESDYFAGFLFGWFFFLIPIFCNYTGDGIQNTPQNLQQQLILSSKRKEFQNVSVDRSSPATHISSTT